MPAWHAGHVEAEELGAGPESEPRPRRFIAVASLLVLAALVAWLVIGSPAGSDAGGPIGSPPVSPVPSPDSSPATGGNSSGVQVGLGAANAHLEMGKVCRPVTDGHSRLKIRFTLINGSRSPVTMLDVHPVLPLGGLVNRRTTVRLGTCAEIGSAPLAAPRRQILEAGQSALISFDFRLPPQCPEPLPVQAAAATRISDKAPSAHRTRYALYPDLGSIAFDTC